MTRPPATTTDRTCPGPGTSHPTDTDGQPAPPALADGEQLCRRCSKRLADALRDLPELYVHLWLAATPGRRPSRTGGKVTGSPEESRMPIDPEPGVLMRDIVDTLDTWASEVRAAVHLTDPAGSSRPVVRRGLVERRGLVDVETDDGRVVTREMVVALDPVDVAGHAADRTDGLAVDAAAFVLAAHTETLLALPSTTIWARVPLDRLHGLGDVHGYTMAGGARVQLDRDGIDAATDIIRLRSRARSLLGHTRGRDRLPEPCPNPECEQKALIRLHGADNVECEACGERWAERDYERLMAVLGQYRANTKQKRARA